MPDTYITIIGAGVIGLTTALQLSKCTRNKITVVAKFMPGDYDAEYTSPWAGANFFPMGSEGSEQARYETETWPWLRNLAQNHPGAGVHFQPAKIKTLAKDIGKKGSLFAESRDKLPWWKDLVLDFQCTVDADNSIVYSFTSVCINTAIYLPWLLSNCLQAGVVFKRVEISSVTDAVNLHHTGRTADIIVNCTGLQSRTLGGVEDKTLVPIRGQIVLVRNPGGSMFVNSATDDGFDGNEGAYSMSRAAGGGTVLGGTFDPSNESPIPDPEIALRIMQRTVKHNPALTNGKCTIDALSVVRHGVGFRPFRPAGARVGELEMISGIPIIHNYGHGGWGYQGSLGSANDIVKVVEQLQAKTRSGNDSNEGGRMKAKI